jgi:recombination protein RecT
MTNKIVKQDNGGKTIKSYVKSMESGIKAALPSVMTPERFTRMVLTALSSTPELNDCTPQSFLGAMMSAAQLGLEPNTPLGQAYLIPYWNTKKGTREAQFQIGYKGLIDLAYRSGEVELVQAQCVYANDSFECRFGLDPKLEHIPADGERGELVKVYALFKTKSGGFGFEVMSVEDIKEHAKKYSQSFNKSYSPWKTNFEEMAKKTVLKKCLKYAPLKSDFARGITADETIKTEISDDMYAIPAQEYYEAEAVDVNPDTGEVIPEN